MDNTQTPIFSSSSPAVENFSAGGGAQPYNESPLASSSPKRNKKILIILCLVLVFAALILGIFAVFFIQNPSRGGDFNRYANYILYGDKKDANIAEEYDDYVYYALDSTLESGTKEEKLNFLTTAKTLFEPLAGNSKVNYLEHIEFLQKNIELGDVTPESLLDKYEELGFTGASDYIDDFYSSYNELEYYNSSKFLAAKTNELKGYLGFFSIVSSYFDFDTISSKNIDFSVLSTDDLAILEQKNSDIKANSELATSIVEKATNEIIRGCFYEE